MTSDIRPFTLCAMFNFRLVVGRDLKYEMSLRVVHIIIIIIIIHDVFKNCLIIFSVCEYFKLTVCARSSI